LLGEYQGPVGFVVGLTAKYVVVPSRDGALGVIGVSSKPSLTNNDLYIKKMTFMVSSASISLK
jgi:hypothetical protein